jgi:hypothetical protein
MEKLFPLTERLYFSWKNFSKKQFPNLILFPFFLAPNYVNLKKNLSISVPANPHKISMGFSGR